MPFSIIQLGNFSSEFNHYLENKNNNIKSVLVPNYNGSFVYSSSTEGSILGKISDCFWSVVRFFYFEKIELDLFKRAFLYASYSSSCILEDCANSYQIYESNLKSLITTGKLKNEVEFSEAKWKLAEFETTLSPVYRKIKDEPNVYQDLFKKAFQTTTTPDPEQDSLQEKGFILNSLLANRLTEPLLLLICRLCHRLCDMLNYLCGKNYFESIDKFLFSLGDGVEHSRERYTKAINHQFATNEFLDSVLLPIVAIETATGFEMPIKSLAKVFLKKARSSEESLELKNWSEKIYKWRNPLAAHYLHNGLTALQAFLRSHYGNSNQLLDVHELEWVLISKGKEKADHLYTSRDAAQIKWIRENISQGKQIENTPVGDSLKINQGRVKKDLEICGCKFYQTEESLFQVPPNCSLFLKMSSRLDAKEQAKNLAVIKRDDEGHFALLEPIEYLLTDRKWSCLEVTDYKQDPLYQALLKQVKIFLDSEKIPVNLNPSFFAWTKKNELKALQSLRQEAYNVEKVKEYLGKVFHDSRDIYTEFLEDAQINLAT